MNKFNNVFSLVLFTFFYVTLMSSCRSVDMNRSSFGESNLYGDPVITEIPLNDIDELPIDGNRTVFAPVRFSYDSSQLNPSQAAICEGVAQYLINKRGVILEGHADERGSRDYNLALGEKRALAVRAYLIELGVNPEKIQTRSYGEEKPANPNHDESAWSENRRVEFAIY